MKMRHHGAPVHWLLPILDVRKVQSCPAVDIYRSGRYTGSFGIAYEYIASAFYFGTRLAIMQIE